MKNIISKVYKDTENEFYAICVPATTSRGFVIKDTYEVFKVYAVEQSIEFAYWGDVRSSSDLEDGYPVPRYKVIPVYDVPSIVRLAFADTIFAV